MSTEFENYSNEEIKGLILRLVLKLDPADVEVVKDRKFLINVESTDGTQVNVSIPSDSVEVK